ncbi:hypothetical protein SLS55_008448 [Diplodia seriata]|uniref:Cyanovirin-N domain-containing protein n=1 Tax=Diplodia seriata TaxID=420778 RepID=A0ABR3C997_9PEZI
MRFAVSVLFTLLAGFAAGETLDLTGKCTDHDGVYSWDCNINQENTAALTCNSRLSGGGSYCSDCVRLDTPGFFECSCIGNNCP